MWDIKQQKKSANFLIQKAFTSITVPKWDNHMNMAGDICRTILDAFVITLFASVVLIVAGLLITGTLTQ